MRPLDLRVQEHGRTLPMPTQPVASPSARGAARSRRDHLRLRHSAPGPHHERRGLPCHGRHRTRADSGPGMLDAASAGGSPAAKPFTDDSQIHSYRAYNQTAYIPLVSDLLPPAPSRPLRWSASTAAVALALMLTSCAGSDDSNDDAASSSTSSSPTTSAGSTAGTGDVVALAEAFAATLSDDQKTALNQDYTFEN